MRYFNHGILLMGALVALGCSGSDDSGEEADGPTVTVNGQVSQYLGSTIANATVCIIEPALGCATSDANGEYTLAGVPANSVITATIEAEGNMPAVGAVMIGDEDRDLYTTLLPRDGVESLFADAGIEFDTSLGAIAVGIGDPLSMNNNAAGFVPKLSPAAGDGPYYTTLGGIDTERTSTDNFGVASILNLTEGDYQVTLEGPRDCTSRDAPQGPDGSFLAPVMEGYLTYIFLQCD